MKTSLNKGLKKRCSAYTKAYTITAVPADDEKWLDDFINMESWKKTEIENLCWSGIIRKVD